MSENKLKPCPFCGGKAELVFSGKQYGDEWNGYFVVRCLVCGAQSKGIYYRGDPIEKPVCISLIGTVAEHELVCKWNARADNEQM